MEFSSPPSTSPYVTAPTSPTSYMVQYHSAPASPGKRFGSNITDGDYQLTLDDFEFETSKKFDKYCMEFETCDNSEDDQSWHEKRRDRGGSLPEMAFADELFSNGHVMPLKLPPRLQCESDVKYTSQQSITCLTLSPSMIVKSPFTRRTNVDPFVVAMQKVMKEEKRGRNSTLNHHRRARSQSPFRANNLEWNVDEMREEIVSMTPIQPSSPSLSPRKPIESKAKGATYGRWVLAHSKTFGPKSKGSKKPKNLRFGRKEPKPSKPTSNGIGKDSSKGDVFVETKMQKFKGMLVKYASFRKENNEGKMINPISALWKPNYFKKLSFKLKGNSNANGNKKANGVESKLVIVKYKPAALCLGYGLET